MSPSRARRPRALLLENIDPGAVRLLEEDGWDVEHLSHSLSGDELAQRLTNVDLLGIRSKTQINGAVLKSSAQLIAVGAYCIGVNQIDTPEATRRGIAVFNAPFSNTRSVVELTMAEIIALTRRLSEKNASMHAGVWDKSASGSHEIRGRRLGIVGYGNIGSQLSVVAESLGMSVWFYDTADRLALGNARRCSSLDELLEAVDVVSLHVDGRPNNRDFFGEAEFSRMRRGAIFLNLSRGFVVDHQALRENIESGRLAGAAIDVFRDEPATQSEPFVSELQGVANVILTPHIGGSTEEAQVDIGQFVTQKLIDYFREGATTLSINLPHVALAEQVTGRALVHIHHNTPGVLAKINSVFAQSNINIEGQALATRGDIGYVITEIAGELTDDLFDQLTRLDDTIRVRIL